LNRRVDIMASERPSTLPARVTRNFNTENLIKFDDLSPSLQRRFLELEDAINNNNTQYGNRQNNKRITIDKFPPSNPRNNIDIWIDTRYRCLRVFSEDNWEFTRAAWYGGDDSGIVLPNEQDPEIPDPNNPNLPSNKREFEFLSATITKGNITVKYSDEVMGNDYSYQFTGLKTNKVVISWETTSGKLTGTSAYILGVRYPDYKENGTAIQYPIGLSTQAGQEVINMKAKELLVIEPDSAKRKLAHIIPVNFRPAPSSTTYFPGPYPYQYNEADGAVYGATGNLPDKVKDYAEIPDGVTIKITVKVIIE